jgi:alpha-1,2-mannosyltransferase
VGLPAVLERPVRHAPARAWHQSLPLLACAWTASLAVLAVWVVRAFRIAPRSFVDLDVYRLGVRAWAQGADLYGRLPATAYGHMPFVYPPFSVLVLGPLAVLSRPNAIILTLVGSLAALGVVLYLTVRRVWAACGRRGALLATSAVLPTALLLEPVTETLWFGQINIVLMALVVIDCLAVRLPWPRGIPIGIAAAIKLTPAVFLLYFLLRKDFRAAIWMTATALALTTFGFVVSWSDSVRFWFGSSGGARSISATPYYTNQTIDAVLSRWGVPHPAQTVLWLLGSALLVGFAAAGIRRASRMGDTALAVMVTACLGLLISPTSWDNHWVYVAPALVVLAGQAWRRRDTLAGLGWAATCLVVAGVFWSAPFQTLGGTRELDWTAWQQVPGNSFVLVGITLLVVFAASDAPRTIRALRVRLERSSRPSGWLRTVERTRAGE